MTRDEAIKHGQEQLEVFGGEHKEFIEMAVEALEQVPILQNRCFSLTHGCLCILCPYECEHKTVDFEVGE